MKDIRHFVRSFGLDIWKGWGRPGITNHPHNEDWLLAHSSPMTQFNTWGFLVSRMQQVVIGWDPPLCNELEEFIAGDFAWKMTTSSI